MKKRILIVSPFNKGTIGLCSLNLFNAFKQRTDCEVKCTCVHKFEDGFDELDECEYCVSSAAPIYLKWLNLFKQFLWLKRIKKSFKPDITVSTLGGCSTINVLSGGKEKKIGIFHSPHYQEKAKGFLVYLNTLFNYRFIYPRLNRIACVSSEVKNSLLESFPKYKKLDVQVIYNVHNTDLILSKANEEIPQEEEGFVTANSILYIGRLDENKAPIRALYAFTQSLTNLPKDANLIFIGRDVGNIMQELIRFVESNKLQNRVFFLGYRNNPYKYLSKVRCLVSSSYSEGLPGVIIESLLLGKPVVTTNSSEGIWEIMSCHENYNADLTDIFVSSDGIISSNLSAKEKNKASVDIDNLSKALVNCLKSNFVVEFKFKENIQGAKIVEQFLDF